MLIAGGVGITPLMSKIRYLTDLGWPGKIYLVFSVKTERDIIFRDELDALRLRHPNLQRHRDPHPRRRGGVGRGAGQDLRRDAGAGSSPRSPLSRVHICGPTEMTEPTRQDAPSTSACPTGRSGWSRSRHPAEPPSIDPAALANGKRRGPRWTNDER